MHFSLSLHERKKSLLVAIIGLKIVFWVTHCKIFREFPTQSMRTIGTNYHTNYINPTTLCTASPKQCAMMENSSNLNAILISAVVVLEVEDVEDLAVRYFTLLKEKNVYRSEEWGRSSWQWRDFCLMKSFSVLSVWKEKLSICFFFFTKSTYIEMGAKLLGLVALQYHQRYNYQWQFEC